MEQNFKFVEPHLVTVKEVRYKQVVVYADGESEAAWMALKLAEKGAVFAYDMPAELSCMSVEEYDPHNKKWIPRYRMAEVV